MKTKMSHAIILMLCALVMASCQKSCSKNVDVNAPADTKVEHKDVKNETPPSLAGVNFDGLTTAQINSVSKMLSEEVCPCACPMTFAQCLAMKDGCKPASLMADWTVKQLKEGAPEFYLYRAVAEEINTGFLAVETKIDTLGAYRKGNADAPFVIVEFADFECPACKLASAEVKAFVAENKNDVQIYFMHFPLSTHPHAERAAIAAEAAGKQGKFWEMHDMLFAHTGALTDEAINGLAQKLFAGKELKQFEKDLSDPKLAQKIKDHKEYGLNTIKLQGTPTFMFNGRPYNLSSSKDGYQLRLDMEKARKTINCSAAAAAK